MLEFSPAMMTALIALFSLIVAVLSLSRNRRGDERSEAEHIARMDQKLDSIRSGVDDIRVDQRAIQRDVSSLSERVARVEADVATMKEERK